jgi:hypothetical protein
MEAGSCHFRCTVRADVEEAVRGRVRQCNVTVSCLPRMIRTGTVLVVWPSFETVCALVCESYCDHVTFAC